MTRLFRLDALTGNDFIPTDNNPPNVNTSNNNNNVLSSKFPPVFDIPSKIRQIFKLPLEEPEERTHILALVDEDLKARLIVRLFFIHFL